MASLDMEVIKDIPGYKVILKAVLRAQIQQLVKQLSEHTEEESVILTANVSDGTLSHLGSDYGKMFLETYSDVKKSFLGFCLQSHRSQQTLDGSNETKLTTQDKSKPPYNSKLHSKVLAKPRHSPYTSSRPQSNSPSGLKKGSSGISSKSDGVVEKNDRTKNDKASSQDKGETVDLNSLNLMEVQVKQEPEDVTDEISDHSVKEHSNIDWNKSVVSLSGKDQLALDSEIDSQLNANNKGTNTSLNLFDYSDSVNQGAGQWADNSDFKAISTDHIGFHESLHGNNSSIGGNSDDNDKMQSNKNGNLRGVQNIFENDPTKNTSDVKDLTTTDQNDFQSNSKDVDTSDTDVYEDPSSRDDSIKDYLSDDENKINTTNSDTDVDVEDIVKIPPSKSGGIEQSLNIKSDSEIITESLDVMHEVHQTVNKMTHCVARAISEERKENSIVPNELNQDPKERTESIGDSGKSVMKCETETEDINKDNDLQNPRCDDLHDKPYKVLAFWNKIADDLNEASSEVLYDLISDTFKEKHGKDSQGNKLEKKNQSNDSNDSVSNKSESVQTDKAPATVDSEMKIDTHTNKIFEEKKSSEESIQTEDNLLDKETETEDPRNNISGKGDSEKRCRKNSGTQTVKTVSLQSQVCADNAGFKGNTEKGNGSESEHVTKEPSIGAVVVNLERTPATTIATTTSQGNKTADDKSGQIKTPIKNVPSKQTNKGSPRQLKTPPAHANKLKQIRQQVTPSKPGNSFIDNLISKGVPIIIPDDDEEEKHGKEEFMPSPRSTAFELKSKRYHDEIKRISQVEKRQNFAYNQQATSPMTQNSSFMKQQNLPYLQLRQQYQYQDYYGDQQYSNQQFQTQEPLPSDMSAPLLRQQPFTPPKNVILSTKLLGLSPKGVQMKSPFNSPPHQFSPPSKPTSIKGSPYFKQSNITPTKQYPKTQISQGRIHLTQSKRQKKVIQQTCHSLSGEKASLSSNTTIIIDDEPAEGARKQSSVIENLQQKQTYIVKSPHTQQNQSVQEPPPQPVHTVPTNRVSPKEVITNLSSSIDKSLQGLPVIANVESVSEFKNEGTATLHTNVLHVVPNSAELNVDQDLIRQTNERTPIKRTRSDDTMTSPGHIMSEPSVKRRHTSVDESVQSSDISSGTLERNLKSQLEQSGDCQVSPGKIPPKLEIDIDDVPGVLPDLSNQTTTLTSPSKISQEAKEERPIIPLSPQLVKPDLAPFSPPVSPSTRRLHATHGTRSKTVSEISTAASPNDSDNSSVTPQETASQPVKKFGCGDCGKSYTTKAALNQHFRKHTQERPFECDVCGKHYSQKGYLKKHIRTHFETQET